MGPKRSPAMEQFFRAKQAYPDTILFFRLGDFYEMFFEDAVLAADLLDLTLTSRGTDAQGAAIPMAGVPHHAASGYIARLIGHGQRVAICEQMGDPSKVKGIVPREVVRVVTPGLQLDPDALDARAHNYLVCVSGDGAAFGLATVELSTGEARACRLGGARRRLRRARAARRARGAAARHGNRARRRARPAAAQGLVPAAARNGRDRRAQRCAAARGAGGRRVRRADSASPSSAPRRARSNTPKTRSRAAALHVRRIAPYDPSDQLQLDDAAVRNLELVSTLGGERKGSLLHLLDITETAMGARLLRRRLLAPLTDLARIRRRHDQVEALVTARELRGELRGWLARVADLERLTSRAALGVATPRDLSAIALSLAAAQAIRERLAAAAERTTDDALAALGLPDPCADLQGVLAAALVDEPPVSASQGGIFRATHDPRVAELRQLSEHGKDVILELEQRERERTGIGSLKIRFTKVFGYYIEITRSKLGAVPAHYRRKQTVAGGERYTTDELEELQARILNADERMRGLEAELFDALRAQVGTNAPRLERLAQGLADLDVHAALAELAQRHDYVRPAIDDSMRLELARLPPPDRRAHAARGHVRAERRDAWTPTARA